MHILYHHRTQGRRAEGAHIRSMVKAFRQLGHEVNIASFPGVDVEKTDSEATGATQHHVTPISRLIGTVAKYTPELVFELFEILYNLYAFFSISRCLLVKKADFIYERYSLFMVAGVICSKVFRVPLHLEINDSAIVERVRPLSMRRLAKAIEAWIFANSQRNYFISNYFKEHALKAYGTISPSVIVPNAADLEVFDIRRYHKDNIKTEINLGGKLVCGYVGGFLPWHGIGDLVDELAGYLKLNPAVALLLIGDGPEYQRIKKITEASSLETQVIMPGRVNHALVPKYIAAMDFSVLPDSNEYGSPMKLFEYMAMGVPVIAPDYGPVMEVISNNETGWLFPRGDRAACIKLLIDIFGNSRDIARIGHNASHYIRENRTWEKNAHLVLAEVMATTPLKNY